MKEKVFELLKVKEFRQVFEWRKLFLLPEL